jgi:23S rRNA (adenine2030-N6)-methyltransferase
MANVHYASIGDVWKHLPLAEILRIEHPLRYWETHSGSSSYPLTHSPERDYGAFAFLERAGRSPGLRGSAYWRLLDRHGNASALTCPGSPLIAMELLGDVGGHFLFCDLDGESLSKIADDSRALGVPLGSVRLVEGDGISNLADELSGLTEDKAAGTFLLVDPYRPLEPNHERETPMGLFARAAKRGVGCMLWYGFDATSERAVVLEALHERMAGGAWYGEVSLRAEDLSEVGFDPGVLGCGVVVCNVGQEALAACGYLGEELALAYADVRLPNGREGSLGFEKWSF